MNKTNKPKPAVNIKNTPYLIIVESPFKCKKIEKFLGFQYKCIASNGHFREISKIKDKDKENPYEPVFEIIPLKQKHVENMREIISYFRSSPENIFIATDDDREGEAIAWHICMTFELPIEKVHRIIFHEITETVIKEAVLNPMKIRMNIVLAQHARQVLDRLVGFQISPLLTKRMNTDSKYLSAGRCQTPALRLIYDRDKDKNKNIDIDIDIYTINGYFFSSPFPLKFVLSQKLITKEICVSFLEKSREFEFSHKIEKPQQKKISAPLPLNTSALLQNANTLLNLSSKETMDYCQQLYQSGYITYMRTESVIYSKTFISKVNKYIIDTFSPEYIGISDLDLDLDSCPHEAIRVTDLYCKEIPISISISINDKESQKQKEQRQKLYYFIWKRSIESCMSDYVYKQTIVKITAPLVLKNEETYYYEYVLDIPVFLGWTVIEKEKEKEKEEQNKKNGLLLCLQSTKSPIKCMKIECEPYICERKGYYGEAGLIRDLEEYGIGRPSTFSIILQCIQERNYVRKQNIEGETIECTNIILDDVKNGEIVFLKKERIIGKEKNKLVLQELGKRIIEELIPTFDDLFSYDYTKKMEMELDKIRDSDSDKDNLVMNWNSICRECDKTIAKNAKQWKTEMKHIYPIDNKHELLFIKTGPIIRIINDDDDDNDPKSKSKYKRIKSNLKIDFERLRNKNYNLEELLEIPKDMLGEYEGYPLYLKNGQYGLYVTWGEKKESLEINKNLDEINLQDIVEYLSAKKTSQSLNKLIIRVLNDRISIRKSKYGHYIHCSTGNYNIKLFPGNYLNCETNELLRWLENTYGII